MTGPRTCRARWRRNRRTCGPRMFIRGYSASARVSWRRRGDTTSAPMPETFSCERARTDTVGVAPHSAHVRRSTGIIRKPVSSRQIRWAPRRASFFYPGPVLLDPLAYATIVALLRARLGPLRTEATRPQQSPDVIRMVDHLELVTDDVHDPPARPKARGVARRFRPRHDQAHQLPSLGRRQLRRSARRRACSKAGAALPPVGSLPSADGAPNPPPAPAPRLPRGLPPAEVHGREPPPPRP